MKKLKCKRLNEIEGFESFGNYLIASDGKLFNIKTGKQLSSKKQYYQATLSGKDELGNRVVKTIEIHRIVEMAFISNPDNLPEVDHVNGDKYDNDVDNLRWVTKGQNLENRKMPDKKGKTKKTPVIAIDTKTRITFGIFDSLADAARELNVNYSVAYAVMTGLKKATQHGIKFIAI